MEEEDIDRAVMAYLKKKGFKDAERVLVEERNKVQNNNAVSLTDPDIGKQILSFAQLENVPMQYQEGYKSLKMWAYSSLDLYKHELLRVLYPAFIHCFLDLVAQGHTNEARNFFHTFREDHEIMNLRDLQKLEGVLSPAHLQEMEFARSLRQSKVNIKMCEYSYELLLQHLQKAQSVIMLGLINEHINFQVSPGQPSPILDDTDAVSLIGANQDNSQQINQKEVRWGLLEDSIEDRLGKAGGLLSEADKFDGQNKDVEVDDNKRKSVESGKQGPSKKLKKDKLVGAPGKNFHLDTSTISAAPRVKSELPLPVISIEDERKIFDDIRNRVQLNSVSLPSVCLYTVLNAHNGLNCSSISQDGSLLACGFSDSSLKVWDMAKIGQQSNTAKILEEDESATAVCSSLPEDGKKTYTLFRGHAGPVTSVAFSPLGDYMLSSSVDSTVRLWSTKLNANLVCYKGHNYPVWDVKFSPKGHYFVSASHDRTARLWSMERIHPLRVMAGHLSDVDCVQWHENCNYIATGSSDKTVRLWDVQSGECARIFIGHRSTVLCLAMSPDGRYISSGDEDGIIMTWDISTGSCISPLTGHTSCVWTLAFSCEGNLLASGSADSTVKLWDVSSSTKISKTDDSKSGSTNRLRLLKTLPTKSTPVSCLQFSRRNLLFAAGSFSKGV